MTDQKTEIPGIYKVSEGILVNKDRNALMAYKKRREKAQQVDNLQNEVNSLKEMIVDIRDMLKGLTK